MFSKQNRNTQLLFKFCFCVIFVYKIYNVSQHLTLVCPPTPLLPSYKYHFRAFIKLEPSKNDEDEGGRPVGRRAKRQAQRTGQSRKVFNSIDFIYINYTHYFLN